MDLVISTFIRNRTTYVVSHDIFLDHVVDGVFYEKGEAFHHAVTEAVSSINTKCFDPQYRFTAPAQQYTGTHGFRPHDRWVHPYVRNYKVTELLPNFERVSKVYYLNLDKFLKSEIESNKQDIEMLLNTLENVADETLFGNKDKYKALQTFDTFQRFDDWKAMWGFACPIQEDYEQYADSSLDRIPDSTSVTE